MSLMSRSKDGSVLRVSETAKLAAAGPPPKPGPSHYLQDFLVGIVPFLFLIHFLAWLALFPGALLGHADFRQLYAAGYMVRSGHAHDLYNYQAQKEFQSRLVTPDELTLPFIRPAYQALLFAPLSLMKYRNAYLVFLGVNLFLLGICYRLLRPLTNLTRVWSWLPLALVLSFLPICVALMQGQDSILLTMLLAASVVMLDQERDLVAGILVGLGLFKFQIVLPIALLFFLWRRWRVAAGFALSAGAVLLLSIGIVGLSESASFVRSVLSVGNGVGSGGNALGFPLRVTLMANLRGLVFGLAGGRISASLAQSLTVVLSIVVLLWVAVCAPRKLRGSDAMILAITAATVVSYYLFIHDLSVLLIPAVVTLNRFVQAEETGDIFGWVVAGTSALVLLAPTSVFLIPNHFYLLSILIFAFLFLLIRSFRVPRMAGIEQQDEPART
jgi:hypothetical protein